MTTKLNVFTTKLASTSDARLQASGTEQECVLCRLWRITNPGENLKCDECSRKAALSSEATFSPEIIEQFGTEQVVTPIALQVEPANTLSLEHVSNRNGSGRCSACEISAFLAQDPTRTCASCTLDMSSPESPSAASKIKRSCARRPPTKLESHALRCLKKWLRENSSNPYPDVDTKRDLAQQCGITEKQVTTWFTNARARRRVANYTEKSGSGLEEGTWTMDESGMRVAPFLDSSSAHQGSESSRHIGNDGSQKPSSSRRGKKKDYSHLGPPSPASERKLAKPFVPALETIPQDNRAPNMWQCTFCYQNVAPKSWRRHEETQHRPKRKWTCLHTGPLLHLPAPCSSQLTPSCAFCMLQNPSEEHLRDSHRIHECMAKPEEDRTFLRPDHLRQHVKNFHQATLSDSVRDLWRRDGGGSSMRKDSIEHWTCGFCALQISTWDARQTHISGHFKNGATMSEWKCRDPSSSSSSSSPCPLSSSSSSNAVARASRKRRTSSDGDPNVIAKLARNITGLSIRQQSLAACADDHHDECNLDSTHQQQPHLKTEDEASSVLPPDILFTSFTTGVYGEALDFAGTESAAEDDDMFASYFADAEDFWLGMEGGDEDGFVDFWEERDRGGAGHVYACMHASLFLFYYFWVGSI